MIARPLTRSGRALGLAASLAVMMSGCVRTNYNAASHQQEYTLTSTDREVEMGRKIAHQVKEKETVVVDEPMQERVRTIGQRLAAVCDRKELVYQFTVIEDKEVNAFSLPGGYVFVNDGLVKKVATDDELAAVIGHEIAHIVARHAVKRYESGLGAHVVQLASLAAARDAKAIQGLSLAMQAAQLSYARKDELEADRLAIGYLKAARFDPKAMMTFLTRLHQLDQDTPHYVPRGVSRVRYAMTHPYITDRIRQIKEQLFGVADYIDYLNQQ